MKKHRSFPVIVDTTLRDGIQMPGIDLSFSQKKSILGSLFLLGVTEAEIGCPARGTGTVFEMQRLCTLFPDINCSAWCRARTDDIDSASECGVSTIHISFPVSHRHMKTVKWTQNETISALGKLVSYARTKAPFVTVGAQDATRAEPGFLKRFVSAAVSAGANRVRIADTVGIATPIKISELIGNIRQACPDASLEFHGHNDFGLATAVTLAAIDAGADAVSVTVQGVGERAGNAALEEVITAGEMLYGYKSPYTIRHLSRLCGTVSEYFNLPVQPQKAITGKNAFRHESGIHCHGMIRDSLTYQPFNAEVIGSTSRITLGPQSGSSTFEAILKKKGITISRSAVREIWEEIRSSSI